MGDVLAIAAFFVLLLALSASSAPKGSRPNEVDLTHLIGKRKR